MDKKSTVYKIIELVGSEKNINSISHCFTRLRMKLVDRSRVNDEQLTELDAVIGLYDRGEELQIIMGPKVSDYFPEAEKILKSRTISIDAEESEEIEKSKKGIIDTIADISSSIFVPIIGVLAGCGTLQGIVSLLLFVNIIDEASGIYLVLNAIGHSIFYFFPFFLAYTAAMKFGGKPFYSVAIAGTIMYPDILAAVEEGAAISFGPFPLLLQDYSSTVFPVIVAAWLAAVVERRIRKVIPDNIKMIFVPMLTLVIVVPLMLLILGPVLTYVMAGITNVIMFLFEVTPTIAGTLVGGVWQLLVFLGVSKAFIPIFTTEFATTGYSYFGAITFFVAIMGQTGASFGIAARSKEKSVKAVATGAGISGLFGITEPALFGLNIPAKKPFLIGSVSATIGGLVTSLFNGRLYALSTGLTGIPSLINLEQGIDMGFFATIIGSLITFVLSFVVTYKFGWNEENDIKYKSKM